MVVWFYRAIIRYTNISIVLNILTSTLLYGLLFFLSNWCIWCSGGSKINWYYSATFVIFCNCKFQNTGEKLIVNNFRHNDKLSNKKNVLIYGAGEAGRQLLSSLENSREYNVEGFIDDNTQLHRRVLLDKTIFPLSNLKKLIQLKYKPSSSCFTICWKE